MRLDLLSVGVHVVVKSVFFTISNIAVCFVPARFKHAWWFGAQVVRHRRAAGEIFQSAATCAWPEFSESFLILYGFMTSTTLQ